MRVWFREVAVAVALVALTGAGCAVPVEDAPEVAASAAPTETETEEQADPREPVSRKGGARAEVPEAVILQQLRDVAERIASRVPLAVPTPADVDPGTNRALGFQLLVDFGFGEDQWQYLDALWHRESGWNHLAENPSSGAYGIPQSLPANKMAVVGDDWRTNPDTQIRWGLAYIAVRYGTPQGAWQHSERVGWY